MDKQLLTYDVKLTLEASKPLYQEAMFSLEVIADIYKKRQGERFNADVTWEILFDYMNGEMELDECIWILDGDHTQGLHNHYKNMLDAEK